MPDFLINIVASGTTTLVAAPTSPQIIRVLEYNLLSTGTTTVQIFDGPNLKTIHYLTTDIPIVLDGATFDGVFDCSVGNPLLISSSGNVSVGGSLKVAYKGAGG